MKSIFFIVFCMGIILAGCASKKQVQQAEPEVVTNPVLKPLIENEVSKILIIYYDKEIGNTYLLKAVETYGATIIYRYKALHGLSIRIPDNKSVTQAITYFKKVKGVSSVHRNQIHTLDKPVINQQID